MPPARKHPMMNPAHHLHKAVRAHQAVQEGIATHAQKEQDKRDKREDKARADARLLNPVTPHG